MTNLALMRNKAMSSKEVKIPYTLFVSLVKYFFTDNKDPQLEEDIKAQIKAKGVKIIKRDEYIKQNYKNE